MAEELNNNPIVLDATHSIRSPKIIEEVRIQTSDLKRLRWHIDRITIPDAQSHDWISAIYGGFGSLLIPFIVDLFQGGKYIVCYLIGFLLLAILLSVFLSRRNRTLQEANPQQALDEAVQDLKTIYEKANLPYSSPDDHGTADAPDIQTGK